jgi:hypothetical protein
MAPPVTIQQQHIILPAVTQNSVANNLNSQQSPQSTIYVTNYGGSNRAYQNIYPDHHIRDGLNSLIVKTIQRSDVPSMTIHQIPSNEAMIQQANSNVIVTTQE